MRSASLTLFRRGCPAQEHPGRCSPSQVRTSPPSPRRRCGAGLALRAACSANPLRRRWPARRLLLRRRARRLVARWPAIRRAGAPLGARRRWPPALAPPPPGWRETLAPAARRRRGQPGRRAALSERARWPPQARRQLDPAGAAMTRRARRRRALPPAPIAGFFAPGPGGPAADHRPGRPHALRGLRPALPRQRPAQGRPGDRRPRPQRQRHPRRPSRPCRRGHAVLRALRRGPAGLDRHGPRPRPRGAAGSADGADGLSRQRSRPLHPDGRRPGGRRRSRSWSGCCRGPPAISA